MHIVKFVFFFCCLIHPNSDGPALEKETRPSPDKMRGVCWVAGDSIVGHNFDELLQNHVNWISQTPFALQPAYNQPELNFGSQRVQWGERDVGIAHTASIARGNGIRTVLKPHIWLRHSGDKWRSDIAMTSDDDWQKWFDNYTAFILHYARVAEEARIDMLCIGTELYHPSTKYPGQWRQMIRSIRKVYSGKLTYAANFYKEFEQVTWWDALDYIGIQAYFPICTRDNPSHRDLTDGWRPHIQSIEKVYRTYQRPVIFTEIGYRNDQAAAREPWTWPSQLDRDSIIVDDALQARCYEAFFNQCWKADWMGGVFFWKWFHGSWRFETRADYVAYRQRRRDSLIAAGVDTRRYSGRAPKIYFTPQGREAELVMREHFGKAARE